MDYELINIDLSLKQDLAQLNPFNETPVLIDDIDKNNRKKDLILIDPGVICEYIDDRFPHPLMLPTEPSEKARLRMYIAYLDREVFSHLRKLDNQLKLINNVLELKKYKWYELLLGKISFCLDYLAAIFAANKSEYMFGNYFTLLDALMLPLVWRLDYYGLEESKPFWQPLLKYAHKSFQSNEFMASLSPAERNMTKNDD